MYSPHFDNLSSFYELWSKKSEEEDPSLYQPPLYAYSPEYPGSSNLKFNYLVSRDTNQIPPLIQIKLNKMQQTRYYGYKSLRPIGVNQTMEQLEQEAYNGLEPELTAPQTIENDTSAVEQPNDESMSSQRRQHERDEALPLVTPPPPSVEADDLDDDIPNMDESEDELEEDEGFMAEEVEYQNDHSLNEDDISGFNSNATTAVTGNSGSIGRTIATSLTSPMNLRDCEEDMVLDDSS